MAKRREVRPPLACRMLVRMASWIAPSGARAAWRERWDSNLWNWWILFERGELTGRDRAELARYSWGSFSDAFWLRVSREHLKHWVRGGGFVLTGAGVALLALAALTGGFQGTRALFDKLTLEDPGSLVSIKYTGSANEPYGVPPSFVPLWGAQSKSLSGVAGFVHPQYGPHAEVTPNFFALLGVKPGAGRLFAPGDGRVAVIGGAEWKRRFGRDPKAIGATMDVDGQRYEVIGALPDAFWAISRSIVVFTPLDLEPQPAAGLPPLIGAVGRLRPRATPDAARLELFDIARAAFPLLPRPPQVISFDSVPGSPWGYALGVLFAMAIGGALVFRAGPLPSGRGWRYRSFLALKTMCAIVIPALLWTEASSVLRQRTEGGASLPLTAVLLALVFLPACACAIWWSFADQRRRCPVCLQLLGMPVTMGSWASVLDPATTELVCDSGHGSLSVPESAEGAPDRWTNLDPSWRELFSGKT
jgi:hypothetical protein